MTLKIKSGVYRITNNANGKFYIGSSVNMAKRWRAHKMHLKRQTHKNIDFQRAWNFYHEEAFSFEIIEFCSLESLIQREQFYFDRFDPRKNGYNKSPTAGSCKGIIRSEEIKKRISESLKGRPGSAKGRHVSEETKRKISLTLTGRRGPNKGIPLSEEHKNRISVSRKGQRISQETKNKMSISQMARYCTKSTEL